MVFAYHLHLHASLMYHDCPLQGYDVWMRNIQVLFMFNGQYKKIVTCVTTTLQGLVLFLLICITMNSIPNDLVSPAARQGTRLYRIR